MKRLLLILVAISFVFASCEGLQSKKKVELNDQLDSVAYAIGVDQGMRLAQGLANFPDTLDYEKLTAGLVAAMTDGEMLMDQELARTTITAYMQVKQEEEKAAQAEKFKGNLEAGKIFLEENAQNEGVMVTPSGLQYKILKKGNGPKPIDGDRVRVNYEGKLIDGTVFDSSYKRGEPIEFGLDQVIPGWTEGLKLMPVGSTFMLYIPQELAYGENVQPNGPIPPYSTLIFKVELLDIVK